MPLIFGNGLTLFIFSFFNTGVSEIVFYFLSVISAIIVGAVYGSIFGGILKFYDRGRGAI